MRRYLLIDASNILHAANSAKVLKVGNTQVQAIFGFLRSMRKLCALYGNATPVCLHDGASWRHMSFPDYKQNRKKEDTPSAIKQKLAYDTAQSQMPAIKKALSLLGITQVRSNNMEADDLAAILTDRYVGQGASVVLISGDKDWVQLAGPKVLWFDIIRDRKIRTPADVKDVLDLQVTSFDQFVELKCLMGDTGDNIGGVGGIGPAYAQAFLEQYGTVTNFTNQVLDKSIDVDTLPKWLQSFARSEEKQIIFARNRRLMDLRTTARPDPMNLQVDKGEPSAERFKVFCDRFMFKTMTQNYTNWLSVFPAFQYLNEDIAA